jgi:hypothetical protein
MPARKPHKAPTNRAQSPETSCFRAFSLQISQKNPIFQHFFGFEHFSLRKMP